MVTLLPVQPAGLRVLATSAYADGEPLTSFLRAAAADKHGKHRLTDDAAKADLIVFVENSQYHADRFFKRLRNHPLVGKYPNKVFMYNPHDVPWLVLPGLYPSMPAPLFDGACVAACPYVEKVNEYIRCDFAAEPTWLYSFRGNLRMPVRRELPHLQHPRGDVQAAGMSLFGQEKPKAPQVEYADLLANTKFNLCPRGIGTSSFRLFETMQAGRVPVIIADDWVRPQGPIWEEFALFVPEKDLAQIPHLLESAEAQWPAMARRARAAWEEFFAPNTIFHYLIEQLLPLQFSHGVQLAKYYVRSKWLHPVRDLAQELHNK